MLVFIFFSTEETLVSFLCCWFAKVLPSQYTESKDVFICTCPFRVFVPEVSLQPLVSPSAYGDVVSSPNLR